MPTIHPNNRPTSRIDVGDIVLERAKTVSTKLIKARLLAFAAAHKAYSSAETEVRAAEALQQAQEAKAAAADVVQDAAVDALATAMAGDGAARISPFKTLGAFAAPTAIKQLAFAKEAALCTKLGKAAGAWKGGSAKTKAAAKKLVSAAAAVTSALAPTGALTKKKLAAIARRDALGQAWVTSFEKLKNAARTAEDDGAAGLFAALFRDDAPKKPKKKKPAASLAPATVVNGAQPLTM